MRIWNQLTWQLSPKREFIVSKSTTMNELATSIYLQFKQIDPNYAILPEEMDICRILSIHKFNMLDLVDMEVPKLAFSISGWPPTSACSANPCSSIPMACSMCSSRREWTRGI